MNTIITIVIDENTVYQINVLIGTSRKFMLNSFFFYVARLLVLGRLVSYESIMSFFFSFEPTNLLCL